MDRFEQSVAHTLHALKTMRGHGHTDLRASTEALATLADDMTSPALAGSETGTTSEQLREHFARQNTENPVSKPATSSAARRPVESEKPVTMEALQTTTSTCELCPLLAASRKHVVFGSGSTNAELMFIGEAPDAAQDETGEPFSGPAGDLLARIIKAMGLASSDVYFANVLKCHPDTQPGSSSDRPPSPLEMSNCLPYLRQQIHLVQPKVIVALGAIAMEGLIGLKAPVYKMRGRWHMHGTIPIMATFHPSFLVQQPEIANKRKAWEDMLQVMRKLGMPVSRQQENFFRTTPSSTS